MQRSVPLTICLVMGIVMMVQFFSPHPFSRGLLETVNTWVRLISGFALALGAGSLILHHTTKIRRKQPGWGYSIVTLSALAATAAIGWAAGPTMMDNKQLLINVIYSNIQVPLGASMFSILAFYIASASYRAFRARNKEATILLLAAFLVMLGTVPLGKVVWDGFPKWSRYLLEIPNLAAKRGIIFGVALGTIATSLKIILGIERGWLGGGK
ncbi:hypothetical protein FJY71_01345 [candidate division WOR-3 bacterium]|nr:hypothetical protein [candidate division WOR-3 bacterium]